MIVEVERVRDFKSFLERSIVLSTFLFTRRSAQRKMPLRRRVGRAASGENLPTRFVS